MASTQTHEMTQISITNIIDDAILEPPNDTYTEYVPPFANPDTIDNTGEEADILTRILVSYILDLQPTELAKDTGIMIQRNKKKQSNPCIAELKKLMELKDSSPLNRMVVPSSCEKRTCEKRKIVEDTDHSQQIIPESLPHVRH